MLWRLRRRWSSWSLAFLVPTLILMQQPRSQGSDIDQLTAEQMVALFTKPAVVRIVNACAADLTYEYKNKDGDSQSITEFITYGGPSSGFFVNPSGYIVTSAVKSEGECQTELRKKMKSYVSDQLSWDGQIDEDDIDIADFKVEYPAHIQDVYLPNPEKSEQPLKFAIEKSGAPSGGKDIALIKVPVTNAPILRLAPRTAQLQDQISVIGYPIAADTVSVSAKTDFVNETNGLSQKAFSEASVNAGRISNPNKTLEDKSPVLQVDVLSGTGSAGSPIVNLEGEVVGILASTALDKDFYSTDSDSSSAERGIPIGIPASTIQEFMQSTGVENEEGRTDFLFRDGLMAFMKGDYENAKIKFEAVKELFGDHSEVDRLISQSNELLVDQVKQPPYLFYGLIAGIVLALLGVIAFLLKRKPASVKRTTTTAAVPFVSYQGANGNSRPTTVDYSQPYLELEFQGQSRYLTLQKDEHRIGRDETWSDIKDIGNWDVISRQHAILRKEGNGYRIYDGNGEVPSSNGLLRRDNTKVDGTGYLLKNGDELKIGKNSQEQVVITYFEPASSRTNLRQTRMAD